MTEQNEHELDRLWDDLLRQVEDMQAESSADLDGAQADLKTAAAEIDQLDTGLELVWPEKAVERIALLRFRHYIWLGNARRKIRDYRMRMRAVVTADAAAWEWKFNAEQRGIQNRREQYDRRIHQQVEATAKSIKKTEAGVARIIGQWRTVQRKASWLLELPLSQLQPPKRNIILQALAGIEMQYTLNHLIQAARLQKRYQQIIHSMQHSAAWIPAKTQTQIILEECKLSFYRAYAARNTAKCQAIYQMARELLLSEPGMGYWQSEVQSMSLLIAH